LICLGQHGEDPETHPLVDCVIEELRWMRGTHRRVWTIIPAMVPPRAAL
jgi:hypothetical protein